jgi:hypothetical protein
MSIQRYSARDFADSMQALLPPGQAWEWPRGGTGDGLMLAMGQELARLASGAPDVVSGAVLAHVPAAANFNVSAYRAVAQAEAVRQGASMADVQVDHLVCKPLCVGRVAGSRVWSYRARYILRVRYRAAVVDLAALEAQLEKFKQAHVCLWFETI